MKEIDFSQYNDETIKERLNQTRDILARLLRIDKQYLAEHEIALCDKNVDEIRAMIEGLERGQARREKIGFARGMLAHVLQIDKKGMTVSQIENYNKTEETIRELLETLENENFRETITETEEFLKQEKERWSKFTLFINGGEPWKE